jgi:hypothetical protein
MRVGLLFWDVDIARLSNQSARHSVKAVFNQQYTHVLPVEQLDVDMRVVLFEETDLAVLFRDLRLELGGQLNIKVLIREIEIRGKRLVDVALFVKGQRKSRGLMFPGDTIKI